jgi:DNA replication and repair protein RecF
VNIEYLSVSNFRNYSRLEIGLPDSPIIVYGENAQGKTSLLEAIYYLATSKSPYTNSDRQLLHWSTENDPLPFARLAAEVRSPLRGVSRLEIALVLERAPDGSQRFRKTVRINGVDKRVMDTIGIVNVVLFLPRDLTLIEGAPADRRRFMDVTLSQVDADYVAANDKYEKTLPQRNALLRRIADNQASVKELAYWDEQLIDAGSVIISGRQRFLREVEVQAQREHFELTGRKEKLTLRYQPSFTPTFEGDGQMSFQLLGLDLHRELTPDEIRPQFQQQLADEQDESIRRGVTLSGPHRDELRILINDRDAGLYGSRGQARTAVMSLKFAEMAWMQERSGERPILLLDEVAAELDKQRRAYLLDRISGNKQTLLTTTDLDIFDESFLQRAAMWEVESGKITVQS